MNKILTEMRKVLQEHPEAEGLLVGISTFEGVMDALDFRVCKEVLPAHYSSMGALVVMGKSVMLCPGMPADVYLPIYPSSLSVYAKLYAAEFKRKAS